MIVRPLDENGDMMPVYSLDQMKSGKEAVAQVVDLRLNLYYGEWWEDPDLGFRVPLFLINNVRNGDVALLGNYIASYVTDTQGIRNVSDVRIVKHGHNLTVDLIARTDEGRNVKVEVDLSGVL